ncbi:unnamed protein product [Clonostachys chloroleuca]|uniref:NDT80 domain-containing protein n=1 Tax=Clonostachys chloroleuca TaxID=1926264 RepID=A0AA35VNH1_9HYPO|nr:unnamed protein product [Clonostachys chloroleuca]
MTATAAYSATMPDLRGDPAPSSLWPNYGGPVHMTPRISIDAGLSNPPPASPHSGRARSDQASIDQQTYSYSRYSHEDADPYSGSSHTGPSTHLGYQNHLKRPFSQTDQSSGHEVSQDLRGDGSRPQTSHDHKLLSFRRSQESQAITDQHGRLQQLELSAQLHGMFFLSEMPANANDGTALQPELTCYRRNLFQISGSLITPRGQLSVLNESGESTAITSMEVTISAIESVDGNPVRLIVIPWKTPPPNFPDVNQSPDQEPPALPLIPFQEEDAEADGEFAVYPIGWRRLQFRIATANNGRRKELQQHFVLHLKVFGTLSNNSKVVLTESTTAPIVVRGRSPRNFQARKEIPLLGSSAGSRGQALVETGLGVVAGAVNVKQQDAKPRSGMDTMQLPPRSAFTFEAPKPAAPQLDPIRTSSYSPWAAAGHSSLGQVPSSTSGSWPPTTMGTDLYQKVPTSSGASFSTDPQETSLQTAMAPSGPLSLLSDDDHSQPIRPQYTYIQSSTTPRQMAMDPTTQIGPDSAVNVPRYVDEGRPTKAFRNAGHQSVHSSGSIGNSDSTSEYRYGSYTTIPSTSTEIPQPSFNSDAPVTSQGGQREIYPPTQSWTTSSGGDSSILAYSGTEGHPYTSPYDHQKSRVSGPQIKGEGQTSQPESYSSGHRGSFDAMNNYSWSNS